MRKRLILSHTQMAVGALGRRSSSPRSIPIPPRRPSPRTGGSWESDARRPFGSAKPRGSLPKKTDSYEVRLCKSDRKDLLQVKETWAWVNLLRNQTPQNRWFPLCPFKPPNKGVPLAKDTPYPDTPMWVLFANIRERWPGKEHWG